MKANRPKPVRSKHERPPTQAQVAQARQLIELYKRAVNPVALTAIGVCMFGPLVLADSAFLQAFPSLRPALMLVMAVAWLNGLILIIAKSRAAAAKSLLSRMSKEAN